MFVQNEFLYSIYYDSRSTHFVLINRFIHYYLMSPFVLREYLNIGSLKAIFINYFLYILKLNEPVSLKRIKTYFKYTLKTYFKIHLYLTYSGNEFIEIVLKIQS